MFNQCPHIFVLNIFDGKCLCDPLLRVLDVFSSITCNINDHTILRPPNTWISPTTINNSHTYDVSLQCPFDYCLPHSFSQMQMNNVSITELEHCMYIAQKILVAYLAPLGVSYVPTSTSLLSYPSPLLG